MRRLTSVALFMILALPLALDVSTPSVFGNGQNDPGAVYVLDPDTDTKGNWIGVYGSCAYILPNTTTEFQVVTGKTTPTSLGQQDKYWIEYWAIPGLTETPYHDYIGGRTCVYPYGPVKYEVAGPTEGPRALVTCIDEFGIPHSYRTGVWRHPDSFTITLSNIPTGSYQLALYFQDWGQMIGADTKQDVTVSTPEYVGTVTENIGWFFAGVYLKFKVEVGVSQQIDITITKTAAYAPYAILSGIFLDETTHSGAPVFDGSDWDTKGNWIGNFGTIYYNLAAINCTVPLPKDTIQKPINPIYDVKNKTTGIDYSFSSGAEVEQYSGADAESLLTPYPLIGQYAAYTWMAGPYSDERLLLYPTDNPYCDYPPTSSGNRYFGVWDCGEERDNLNYFTVNLTLPPNWYNMSLYFVDYEKTGRSQTVEIFDETMTSPPLASVHISAGEINDGIYERFHLYGGRSIIIKVTADPGNLNCFLGGIFLDSIALFSSDISGNEKNEFDVTDTVYVTLPATGQQVRLYVLEDKAVWNFGDPLVDVSTDGYNLVTLGTGGYETHWVWEPLLTPGSYDIVEDTNQNGVFDAGDRIDSCNVTTGFFVISELPLGTITALLATLASLILYKKRA